MELEVDTLRVKWSKRERDLMYHYERHASDGSVLHTFLEGLTTNATCDGKTRNLRQELEARGFDITTLKFSIQRFKKIDA